MGPLLLLTALAAVRESPPARYDAAALRSKLAEARSLVTSLEVTYHADGYGPDFPPGTYLHRVVAAASPCYFDHLSAHGSDELDWRDDFLQQRTRVTERGWVTEYPLSRVFFSGSLRPQDPLPGTMPLEIFFLATGLWPLRDRPFPKPEGRIWTLSDVATVKVPFDVRPRMEQVQGRWCHVVVLPDRDLIWLDVDRSCAVMAREMFDPKSGRPARRYDLGGHKAYAPHLFLRGWIRVAEFDLERQAAGRDPVKSSDAYVRILSVKVNQQGLGRAPFNPPSGALEVGPERSPVQASPGGLDLLDATADRVRRVMSKAQNDSWFPGLGHLLWSLVLPFIAIEELRRLLRPRPSGAPRRRFRVPSPVLPTRPEDG